MPCARSLHRPLATHRSRACALPNIATPAEQSGHAATAAPCLHSWAARRSGPFIFVERQGGKMAITCCIAPQQRQSCWMPAARCRYAPPSVSGYRPCQQAWTQHAPDVIGRLALRQAGKMPGDRCRSRWHWSGRSRPGPCHRQARKAAPVHVCQPSPRRTECDIAARRLLIF